MVLPMSKILFRSPGPLFEDPNEQQENGGKKQYRDEGSEEAQEAGPTENLVPFLLLGDFEEVELPRQRLRIGPFIADAQGQPSRPGRRRNSAGSLSSNSGVASVNPASFLQNGARFPRPQPEQPEILRGDLQLKPKAGTQEVGLPEIGEGLAVDTALACRRFAGRWRRATLPLASSPTWKSVSCFSNLAGVEASASQSAFNCSRSSVVARRVRWLLRGFTSARYSLLG